MKRIFKILLGLIIGFISLFILNFVFEDKAIVINISVGIGLTYYIVLSFINYIMNVKESLKSGGTLNNSLLLPIIISIVSISSGKGVSSTLVSTEGSYIASNEFSKANNKLGLIVYTLFYISLWSLLIFIIYVFNFSNYENENIGNMLLYITFFSSVIAIFIVVIFGLISVSKRTKKQLDVQEMDYQQLKSSNPLAYDIKVFKAHYGKPYYLLAYIVIVCSLITLVCDIFDIYLIEFLNILLVYTIALILAFGIVYLPLGFPVILHTKKMIAKRQVINLQPLSVKMIPKDGHELGNYERIIKYYNVCKVDSYTVSLRYIKVYGEIEYIKEVTFNSSITQKSKIINCLKIPRVFNNEDLLIKELEMYRKNEHNN